MNDTLVSTTVGAPWIIIGWAVVVSIACTSTYHLADLRSSNKFMLPVVALGWAGPLSILYFLPLDLSSSSYRACLLSEATTAPDATESQCIPPSLYLSPAILQSIWQSIYWTLFCVTWFAIPILQSYCDSGGFTFRQSLRKSLHYNAWYYGVIAVLALLALAYITVVNGPPDFKALKGIGMALSNAYGLILLILCLSYGLVDVPRELWNAANFRRALSILEYRAPHRKDSLVQATRELDAVYKEIASLDRAVAPADQVRVFVDMLLRECPPEHLAMANAQAGATGFSSIANWFTRVGNGASNGTSSSQAANGSSSTTSMTLKDLQQLHRSLKRARLVHDREKFQWDSLIVRAHFYQDILDNEENTDRRFHVVGRYRSDWRQRFEFVWYMHLRAVVLQTAAVLCGILSLAILWSEVTMNMGLSVLALVMRTNSYTALQAVCLCAVVYMTVCAFVPLLSLKVFSIHQLAPNHHTRIPSMLFFAAQMTRFTFPMCWNFTNLANAEKLVFSQVMGTVNLVPLLGEGFNDWVPITLVILCAVTVLNVQSRIFQCFGMDTSYIASDDGDEISATDRADGRVLLQEARAQRDAVVAAGGVYSAAERQSTAVAGLQLSKNVATGGAPTLDSASAATQPLLSDSAFVPLSKRGKVAFQFATPAPYNPPAAASTTAAVAPVATATAASGAVAVAGASTSAAAGSRSNRAGNSSQQPAPSSVMPLKASSGGVRKPAAAAESLFDDL
ncbi:LMBR1-like membrane protein-domain-containing protein [Blastocladiella britannica]|nr:LMBR1-like membrane protein-domain-containing protein [Blastocladiella britannica]